MIADAVIGCIAYSGKSAMSACVARGVTDEWFDGENRKAWDAAFALFGKGRLIDMPMLIAAGCDAYHIQTCIDAAVPSSLHQYIETLECERKVIVAKDLAMQSIALTKHVLPDTVDEVIARLQAKWGAVGLERKTDESMGKIAERLINEWEHPTPGSTLLKWTLPNLDRHLQPISDELIYLAAKESVGKTALATQMCVSYGQSGITTSLLSLESSRERVARRLIANVGRVNTVPLIRRDAIADYEKARESVAKIDQLPIRIEHRGMDVDQIRAWSMMEKAAGSKLLVIDNMRHIRVPGGGSPVEQFRTLSVQLKWIRDDVGLPVMILHHLNDDDDVSWSKDIRRDADILMFLVPDNELSTPWDPKTNAPERRVVTVLFDKNRDGRRGIKFKCDFDVQTQTWSEYGVNTMDTSEDGL